MACYHPLKGWRSASPNENGKHPVVFEKRLGFEDKPVTVPCGQCIGCRIEKSRQWAIRCSHEASLYEDNCFITLTYEDAKLPPFGSLDVTHFQKFMKRLRKKYPQKIRFFHCGEYGEDLARPHYHACLFNMDFSDKVLFKIKNQQRLYVSNELLELWPLGQHTIGDVTFQSAAYVARYVTKKITGERSLDHYQGMDPETGEISAIRPEYATMSRRPGIGAEWLKKYKTDVFPDDFIIIDGKKIKTPKYYSDQYKKEDETAFIPIRGKRAAIARGQEWNNTPQRLKVRETVQKARLSNLKRELEQ